jgi:hypothetical protein
MVRSKELQIVTTMISFAATGTIDIISPSDDGTSLPKDFN